jgi:hypothetical protein
MGETRVNLKRLLEDIRDGYPYPLEEAIVVELIANALDAKASQIGFLTHPTLRIMSVIDNGNGMGEREFVEFHDIAATTKIRGKGIGFAGVGVKLALLIAEKVITETKRGSFHKATQWRLESPQRAPWDYITPDGLLDSLGGGTAVSIISSRDTELLKEEFIEHVVQTHFYPILHEEFMNKILKLIYKWGVKFYVNGKLIQMPQPEQMIQSKLLIVQLGRRGKLVGVGLLSKSKQELSEDEWGIAISTYGKVVKRGWDWIGMVPRNPKCLTGIVEIPQLSEILTTNKADFLKDGTSLQKYYRYRKAIQEAMEPILKEFGEISEPRERVERDLRPLEREIEQVLGSMLDDFPELSPLLGRRGKGEPVSGVISDPNASLIGTMTEGVEVMTGTRGGSGEGGGVEATEGALPGERIKITPEATEPGSEHEGRRRRPGLMIGFDEASEREDLGWLTENTVWVNKGHPAFRRAVDSGADENYHTILTVAWVLSNYLEAEKSPQKFINRFLSSWGTRL